MKHTSLSIGAFLALTSLALHAIDTDADGMCDVWEARYNAGALLANDDTDGDGASNAAEADSGTDPFNAQSCHKAAASEITPTHLSVVVPSQIGKTYQLTASNTLSGSFSPVGVEQAGNGGNLTFDGLRSGDRRFFRVEVNDIDSDGDGISDWAENLLSGFDPNNDDSFTSGIPNNDQTAAQEILQALLGGQVTATVHVRDAFELESTPATINISRSGSTTYPLTVFFQHRGHADVTKANAKATDYTLEDKEGGTPVISLAIPAGDADTSLSVKPTSDGIHEVPEHLIFNIHFVGDGLLTRICDATNIPANERLFFAAYTPETTSPASGYSIIRLQGDNDAGLVSCSFQGLTSVQTAAHIHIKNPITGPHIESLPMGQIVDYEWQLRAAHFLTTDQAVLDALFGAQLYSNVHSEIHPAGEIRADYLLTTGNTSFTAPPAPPAIAELTENDLDRDIARFLTQCTFGPTPDTVEELRTLINSSPHEGDRISAFSAWLDDQLEETVTPPASIRGYCLAEDSQLISVYLDPNSPRYDPDFTPNQSSRRNAWWSTALFSNDQVRQRFGQALIEIFVTSTSDNIVDSRHYGHAHYYDMLVEGIGGNYRSLIENISTHPIMGHYLSHLRNQKEQTDGSGNVLVSPDENFAREIMQLFSIGLIELHPDGSLKISSSGQPVATYSQADIIDLARLFTGWSFSVRNSPSTSTTIVDNNNFLYGNGNRFSTQAQWTNPMKQFAAYHDTGAKSVIGLDINAGQTGEAELDLFLDHLAAHPNVAPFMARRLIQRLVTSNPSAGYVHRVATTWSNTNGDLTQVFKAILLDYEARTLEIADRVGFGKKKEPLIHYTAIARAIQSKTELMIDDLMTHDSLSPSFLDAFAAGAGRFGEGNTDGSLGQTPFGAPSVFNWFLPDYSTGDAIADAGMVTPELQISTESSVIAQINRHWAITAFPNGENGITRNFFADMGYGPHADHLIPDSTQGPGASQVCEQVYMAVMDENGDGVISDGNENPGNPDDPDNGGATVTPDGTGDPAHFNNPTKIREACAALVDHLDLLLCAGTLKADYGGSTDPENPRDIIIDFLVANSSWRDNDHNIESQQRARQKRYNMAAYLISSCPQSMIQR